MPEKTGKGYSNHGFVLEVSWTCRIDTVAFAYRKALDKAVNPSSNSVSERAP
ncbi:hypothetical protein [Chitinophaga filiformis]|uniref:hypothetical protein n=1 Tax=Chitinophaga filiformis TaxID=104663 RepID=UPI0015A00F16|nr:hypothetical protein [Chitinophaga filiformis]